MDILQQLLQQHGYLCIFVLVLLEYANAPLPSEIVLPLIGFLIADGYMGFVPALLVSIIAGVLGSLTNYIIGRYFGEWTTNVVVSKNKKLEHALNESMKWINKYGNMSVMIGRVIPLIRTIVAIPAGIIKMPIITYIMYSSIGISIWNTILITMGFAFAGNIEKISIILKRYSSIVLFLVILALIILIIKKYKEKKTLRKQG